MIFDELGNLTPEPLKNALASIAHHAEEVAKRAFDYGATHVEQQALQAKLIAEVSTAFAMTRLKDIAKGTKDEDEPEEGQC